MAEIPAHMKPVAEHVTNLASRFTDPQPDSDEWTFFVSNEAEKLYEAMVVAGFEDRAQEAVRERAAKNGKFFLCGYANGAAEDKVPVPDYDLTGDGAAVLSAVILFSRIWHDDYNGMCEFFHSLDWLDMPLTLEERTMRDAMRAITEGDYDRLEGMTKKLRIVNFMKTATKTAPDDLVGKSIVFDPQNPQGFFDEILTAMGLPTMPQKDS